MEIWWQSFPPKENSKCKGPEVGMCLARSTAEEPEAGVQQGRAEWLEMKPEK